LPESVLSMYEVILVCVRSPFVTKLSRRHLLSQIIIVHTME
jgi:hypothetical protein